MSSRKLMGWKRLFRWWAPSRGRLDWNLGPTRRARTLVLIESQKSTVNRALCRFSPAISQNELEARGVSLSFSPVNSRVRNNVPNRIIILRASSLFWDFSPWFPMSVSTHTTRAKRERELSFWTARRRNYKFQNARWKTAKLTVCITNKTGI